MPPRRSIGNCEIPTEQRNYSGGAVVTDDGALADLRDAIPDHLWEKVSDRT